MTTASRRGPRVGRTFSALLAAACEAQPGAFAQLYRALAPAVMGYLRMQGAHDPEDLTNEVFLGVFGAINGFSGDEDAFRSWVFTIAHRRLTDDRRRRGRRPVVADGVPVGERNVPGGNVEEEALRRLSTDRVRALADRLAPDQRDVVLLRMVGGLTVEQVAEALGKPPTAIKALQRRAVGTLRRIFEREGVSL